MIQTLKYLILSIFFICIFEGRVNAQKDLETDLYKGEKSITASNSIILKPGFHIPPVALGQSVRIYTGAFFESCSPLANNPSGNQNYILIKNFKIAGVLTDADALQTTGRKTCEVNQTVQYVDGLGRSLQTVMIQGSPDFSDLIQPVGYDVFGREEKKYLPYASAGNGGAYRADALNTGAGLSAFYDAVQPGVTPTAFPFSQTVFESSPLNRPLEQGYPGADWQPVAGSSAGHTSKIAYGTNSVDDIRLWTVTVNGATSGYYAAGRLYKTTAKDENWKVGDGNMGTIDEYKNLEGQLVLKRTWETNDKSLDIYYLYDDFGNLRYVLPPAVNLNGKTRITSFQESQEVFKQFIYGYHYDARNRLVNKKIPGKGWEFMVYNRLDQLVLSQDSMQRSKPIKEWLFTKYDVLGRVVVTGLYADNNSLESIQATVNTEEILWEKRANTETGYDNLSFPRVIPYYHTINYYDDYNFPGNSFGEPATGLASGGRVKSLPTGSMVTTIGTGIMLLNVNYYDLEGRLVQLKSKNHLGGEDITDITYNFAGELIGSTRSHIIGGNISPTIIANRYAYDHIGRKVALMESINGQPEVVLNKTEYNALGQLLRKNLHSMDNDQSYLQHSDYVYNERGWMKTSSSNEFSLELKYNSGIYAQWNGNISSQVWKRGAEAENTFTYQYDKLNRLTNALSSNLGEVISYDELGNIKTLKRDGFGTNTYSGYIGNQLIKIEGFTNSVYTHDGNGNLTSDPGKEITSIAYNYLNLPEQVIGKTNVTYTYDAMGMKLAKNSEKEKTDYINGVQHKADGSIDFILTENGLARNNLGNYSYEYTLSDHLGNNRITFYKNPGNNQLQVLQRDDYYAFGLRKSQLAASNENKYLYNGKELQQEFGEFGELDYGARFYDPVIGRFNTIDPLAEQMRRYSPYVYGFSNPIRFTDPDGMAPSDIVLRGSDKKEWRIITAGDDVVYNVPFALKNNSTIDIGAGNIDPSRFAVGYTTQVDVGASAVIGGGVGLEASVINFTDKNYSGYNYVYAGAHESLSGGVQASLSANVGGSVSIAYNTSKDKIDPTTYAGITGAAGVSADVKIIAGGGVNISKFTGSGKDPGWKGVSLGVSIGVGAGGNLGAVSGTLSRTWLLNDVKPTAQRSVLDRVFNALNPVGSALTTGTMDKIKRL